MSKCHKRFKETWEDYPSQDNEGYQPERGSYKAGFCVAWREREAELKQARNDNAMLIPENQAQGITIERLAKENEALRKLVKPLHRNAWGFDITDDEINDEIKTIRAKDERNTDKQ